LALVSLCHFAGAQVLTIQPLNASNTTLTWSQLVSSDANGLGGKNFTTSTSYAGDNITLSCTATLTLSGDSCPGPVNLTLASCIKPDGFSPVSGLFASPPSAEDLSGSANSICSIKITLYHSGDNITAGMHEAVDPFGTEVRIVFGTSTTIPARAPLSVGAIVGIAVGCAFVVFIFAFIVSTVLCNGDKGNYDAAAAVAAKAAARQAAYVPPVRNTHIPPVVQQQNRHDADLMPDLAVALADGNNRSPVKPPLKSSVKLRKSAQSADTSPKVLRDSQIAAMSEDELLRLAMEESMKTASKSEIKQSKRAPPPKRADVDDLELAIQMSLAADSPQTAEKNKGRDSISSSTSQSLQQLLPRYLPHHPAAFAQETRKRLQHSLLRNQGSARSRSKRTFKLSRSHPCGSQRKLSTTEQQNHR
jgi:hypothetical protein